LRQVGGVGPDELAPRLVLWTLARRIEAATVEPAGSRARSSRSCAPLRRICSTSRASARSSPPSCSSPGHTPVASARKPLSHASPGVGAAARLQRPDDPPPAQPRGDRQLNRALHTVILHRRQHDRGDQGLHRPPCSRGQEPPRGDPAAEALSRPPPLPATAEAGAVEGLTGHRSFIPELTVIVGGCLRGFKTSVRALQAAHW
jgi:hypothetical protein